MSTALDKLQELAGPKKSCTTTTVDFVNFKSVPFIVLSLVMVAAIAISITSIILHFINFNKPSQQIYVIAIILIVPVYESLSWSAFTLEEGRRADNLIMVRDAYDAVIIYAFYNLLLQYIGPTTASQKEALARKQPSWIPFLGPCWKIAYDPTTPNYLWFNNLLVIQFVLIKFGMTILSLVFQFQLDNCADATNLKYGNPWYVCAQFISLPLALYGIVAIYHPFHEEVSRFYAVQKFVAVKGVILFGFLQDMIMLALYKSNKISLEGNWTLTRIEAFLMCVEMLILAVVLLFYFSHREYSAEILNEQDYPSPTFSVASEGSSFNDKSTERQGREFWFLSS